MSKENLTEDEVAIDRLKEALSISYRQFDALLAAKRVAESRVRDLSSIAAEYTRRMQAAETRLATAEGVLRRARKYIRGETITQSVLLTDLDTLLASAQPTAPTVYHMVGCDARDGLACTHECATHTYEPAAPYVQPKGKAGQFIHRGASFDHVMNSGGTNTPGDFNGPHE